MPRLSLRPMITTWKTAGGRGGAQRIGAGLELQLALEGKIVRECRCGNARKPKAAARYKSARAGWSRRGN